ncbi:MAG: family 10 glycosylhydrolase [Rhodothermia bacterium]|nr:MAG: family 10 glycosylhydrolase [Rhodothermia bacterium]
MRTSGIQINCWVRRTIVLFSLAVLVPLSVNGQSEGLKHEFRGAWIATVINLDWPTSPFLSTSAQKTELNNMLRKLRDVGINTVFFQIRSESDAMYDSPLEPWSYYLTGQQGRAPDPYYDPLEYAIRTAHDYGMELHAWMNPFRVERAIGNYTLHDTNVAVEHPEWLIRVNSFSILNPGIPEARDYIVDVISDVVTRYDVDGIHFDDFFYPYPPNQINLEDLDTFNTYGGALNLFDWRRDNINQFVRAVSERIKEINPDVKFGISPFGIWRSGVPVGIVGLSAVDVIFGDAVKWMEEGWVDYVAPQLYWPFGGGQDFGTLAPWWVSVSNRRHIYPGLGVYRSERKTFSGTLYAPTEIPNQIRFSRATDGVEGNVLFRAENITRFPSQGLADSLSFDLYRNLALTPIMAWRDLFNPDPPRDLGFIFPTKKGGVSMTWSPPIAGFVEPRRYALYRTQSLERPDPRDVTNDSANLLAVSYSTFYNDEPPVDVTPYWYVVTSLSANSVESTESEMIMWVNTGASTESTPDVAFQFESVSPNPMYASATIRYSLDRPDRVSISVYDIIGREVAVVSKDPAASRGNHITRWNGSDASGRPLPSGTYFIVLRVGLRTQTKPIAIVR